MRKFWRVDRIFMDILLLFLILYITPILPIFLSEITFVYEYFHKNSNISGTLVNNKITDIVGASPVGAAPTRSSFLT